MSQTEHDTFSSDPEGLLRHLIQHVETDELLGVNVMPAPSEVLELYRRLMQDANTQVQQVRQVASSPQQVPQKPVAPAVTATSLDSSDHNTNGRAIEAPARIPELDAQEKQVRLNQLAEQIAGCEACPLFQGRKQTVFGEGFADADLMFVGEGPGQTEDELGRPFVGKAGALLDKMILAMGYRRDDVFIANVVKCRPPNNRTPTPVECETCYPYLLNQIAIIQPKVIVTLGGPASKTLLSTTRGITSIRGSWGTFTGLKYLNLEIPLMPTFHPAYLLRSYTHENRAKVWSDLQQAMKKLS